MKRLILILLFVAISNSIAFERYELNCDKQLFEQSLKIALGEVGVKEATGNNDGVRIREYLASVGLREGNPYCAAGQYWSFLSASSRLIASYYNVPNRLPIKKTGSSYLMFLDGKQKGRKTIYKAKYGDLIFWRNHLNYRLGHVERIFEVGSAGWVKTIAFNVDNGVFIKQRNYLHPLIRMPLRGLIGFKVL